MCFFIYRALQSVNLVIHLYIRHPVTIALWTFLSSFLFTKLRKASQMVCKEETREKNWRKTFVQLTIIIVSLAYHLLCPPCIPIYQMARIVEWVLFRNPAFYLLLCYFLPASFHCVCVFVHFFRLFFFAFLSNKHRTIFFMAVISIQHELILFEVINICI